MGDKSKTGRNTKALASPSVNKSDSDNEPSMKDLLLEVKSVKTIFEGHEKLRSDYEHLSKGNTVLQCKYDRLLSDYEKLCDRVDLLESKMYDIHNAKDQYTTENEKLKEKIETLENIAEDAETSQRASYLVISNLKEDSSKTDEQVFIDLCNSSLELPESITKQDIANVSRMKGNNNTSNNDTGRSARPKLMVIKFQNEKIRNSVYSHKKKLKGSGKVISEFLTRKKSALQKKML